MKGVEDKKKVAGYLQFSVALPSLEHTSPGAKMDTRQTTLRYHLRAQALSHGIKAIGGGGLVGGALVFPIAYHESVWLQAA